MQHLNTPTKTTLAAILALACMLAVNDSRSAEEVRSVMPVPTVDIWTSASRNDIEMLERHAAAGTDVDTVDPSTGTTPLSIAAMFGHEAAATHLIARGANVDLRVRDGNAPIHIAAFFGHLGVVERLLSAGADATAKGPQGNTPLEIVSAPWSPELADVYRSIAAALQLRFDLERIKRNRPRITELLR